MATLSEWAQGLQSMKKMGPSLRDIQIAREFRRAVLPDSEEHGGRLVLAILLLAAILMGFLWAMTPVGPTTEVYGSVLRLGTLPSEHRIRAYAIAHVGDREVRIDLHPGTFCRVGDRILIQRQKMAWGFRHRTGPQACSAVATAPPAYSR
ncbi:hypothetical protein [Phenylobacterium sp.]|uniref:hypothetical protein n=1 Tax=Phenylobacterium sp. TaxID=1871053 RepID=UPI00301BEB99